MSNDTLRAFIRFASVGLASNLAGYVAYLIVTWIWPSPKLVVTLMYGVATLIAYKGHARYSFQQRGSIVRFLGVYAIGYVINLLLLMIGTDHMGFPHQAVQLVAVVVVGVTQFFLLRALVFRS
jgi:putative flippase GtrA